MSVSLGKTMFQLIKEYFALYPQEEEHLKPLCAFIEHAENPFLRKLLPGHITGSGIITKDQAILLIHHRYIKEWFQPGGHVDTNETPLQSAIREVAEETGWRTSQRIPAHHINPLVPLDIDAHLIPANPLKKEPEHWHIDFAYWLEPISLGHATDSENNQWFDLQSISAPRLVRVLQKCQLTQ